MFCIRKRRKRRKRKGFILIYVLFIVNMCIFIALNCFKLEVLKRENNLRMEKNILKLQVTQKTKEYMLTDLDEFLYKNVNEIGSEKTKAYLNSTTDFLAKYEDSYIKYDKERDCFVAVYYINGEFYKNEFYEYRIKDKSIFYACVDFSFKKGEVRK